MSSNADYLLQLMKQQVDAITANDNQLQKFLMWGSKKSRSVDVPYKPPAIRILYLGLVFDSEWNTDTGKRFAFNFANALDIAVSVERAFALDFALDRSLIQQLDYRRSYYPDKNLNFELTLDLEPEFKYSLQELKKQLSYQLSYIDKEDRDILKQWWQENGLAWTQKLRAVMIKYRNIGHDWEFTNEHNKLLKKYYDANKLLLECLNSDCYVSREVRQQIEDTLLLPIAEIKQRQQ